MVNWMNCTVRYTRQQEDGTFKRVNEKYLFQADSFTDAEAKVYAQLGSIIRGEFILQDISREVIQDIAMDEISDSADGFWFLVNVELKTESDSGKEKREKTSNYIKAEDLQKAYLKMKSLFVNSTLKFEIVSGKKSPIVEIEGHDLELNVSEHLGDFERDETRDYSVLD